MLVSGCNEQGMGNCIGIWTMNLFSSAENCSFVCLCLVQSFPFSARCSSIISMFVKAN